MPKIWLKKSVPRSGGDSDGQLKRENSGQLTRRYCIRFRACPSMSTINCSKAYVFSTKAVSEI